MDGVEGAVGVEGARQLDGVQAAVAEVAVQEEEGPLGGVAALDPRHRRARPSRLLLQERVLDVGDGGAGEQGGEGEGPAADVGDPVDQAGGEQRGAAQGEEVVGDADGAHVEELLPDAGQLELEDALRGDE